MFYTNAQKVHDTKKLATYISNSRTVVTSLYLGYYFAFFCAILMWRYDIVSPLFSAQNIMLVTYSRTLTELEQ